MTKANTLTALEKITALELVTQKLQNLADELYDLGYTTLGNNLIEQGNTIFVQMAELEEYANK